MGTVAIDQPRFGDAPSPAELLADAVHAGLAISASTTAATTVIGAVGGVGLTAVAAVPVTIAPAAIAAGHDGLAGRAVAYALSVGNHTVNVAIAAVGRIGHKVEVLVHPTVAIIVLTVAGLGQTFAGAPVPIGTGPAVVSASEKENRRSECEKDPEARHDLIIYR